MERERGGWVARKGAIWKERGEGREKGRGESQSEGGEKVSEVE